MEILLHIKIIGRKKPSSNAPGFLHRGTFHNVFALNEKLKLWFNFIVAFKLFCHVLGIFFMTHYCFPKKTIDDDLAQKISYFFSRVAIKLTQRVHTKWKPALSRILLLNQCYFFFKPLYFLCIFLENKIIKLCCSSCVYLVLFYHVTTKNCVVIIFSFD